ncbi:hypothetical protein GCM10009848_51740 [Micromonospora lupini]
MLVVSGLGSVAFGSADRSGAFGSADPDADGAPVCGLNSGPAGPGLAVDVGVDVGLAPAFGRPPERLDPVHE